MKDNTAVIYKGDVLGILYLSGSHPMLEVLRGNHITIKNDEIISYPKREDMRAATVEDFKTHKIHCSSKYIIYQPEETTEQANHSEIPNSSNRGATDIDDGTKKQPFYMVTPQTNNKVMVKPFKYNDFTGHEQSYIHHALSDFSISENDDYCIVFDSNVYEVTTALKEYQPRKAAQWFINNLKRNIRNAEKTILDNELNDRGIARCKEGLEADKRHLEYLETYCAPQATEQPNVSEVPNSSNRDELVITTAVKDGCNGISASTYNKVSLFYLK